jgi:hypothetical protein
MVFDGAGRREAALIALALCHSRRVVIGEYATSRARLDQSPLIVRYPAAPVVGRFLVEQKVFVLKYFLLRNALRSDPRAREGSQRTKPIVRQKRPPAD